MTLKVLGSSSSGHCYLLIADNGETLIIEAGVRFSEVKKALDFDLSKVVGCIISHEHGDHSKYVPDMLQSWINVCMSGGTANALGLIGKPCKKGARVPAAFMAPFEPYKLGSFDIMMFPVEHDAAEPVGYLIRHKECGNVLFATDTYYLRYTFPNLSNILIECNYRLDLLKENYDNGRIGYKRYERTVKSHMSYETCLETLEANDLTKVNNIVLIHLSADNSHESEFLDGIAKATGKTVVAARPGLSIPFNRTPY